ncbi:class I SAM-dependent methyltransferase [Fodinicurvata fenggangensis]|uniref:class I SAM-dependent methyltransferase n=1 Tax=Fodinicurvata fenggangensis TaxID=1121830 RepID=UPI00054FFC58|nr:class I SAM-dependent methyltransferase [Fodinicurvata fenggangensis]
MWHFGCFEAKHYWRCEDCLADPAERLTPEAERQVYLDHENDPHDPGYRRFLSKLADPLCERLSEPADILDYGCGPGPALAQMLREAGHRVTLYDPFFHADETKLVGGYDAITCTEVVEHLHDPASEFERLGGLLRPGGWLAIMTCFQTEDARFANWHYRRDPTHVVFYRAETLEFLAARHGWRCEIPVKDLALIQVP